MRGQGTSELLDGASIVISATWLVFCVVWLIRARSVKATAERQSRAGRWASLVPLLVGAVLLTRPAAVYTFPLRLLRPASFWAPLGAGLCILGLAGAIWARHVLAGNWSGLVTFKEGHELVERGPYRFVRHPIYTSLLLMVLGSALANGRVAGLVALVCFCLAFGIKIAQEEELLLRHFPETYPAYQARVKRLVPFIF